MRHPNRPHAPHLHARAAGLSAHSPSPAPQRKRQKRAGGSSSSSSSEDEDDKPSTSGRGASKKKDKDAKKKGKKAGAGAGGEGDDEADEAKALAPPARQRKVVVVQLAANDGTRSKTVRGAGGGPRLSIWDARARARMHAPSGHQAVPHAWDQSVASVSALCAVCELEADAYRGLVGGQEVQDGRCGALKRAPRGQRGYCSATACTDAGLL